MLPSYRPTNRQLMLFNTARPILGYGSVRAAVGDFFEDMAVHLLKAKRFKTSGACTYCPDLFIDPYYCENKAVGKNGTAFVYAGRLEKDREFAESRPLVYLIWHHRAETKQARDHDHLRYLLSTRMHSLYVVPVDAMYELCRSRPLVKLNTKYYHIHNRSTTNEFKYGTGYRFPISLLLPYTLLWFNLTPESAEKKQGCEIVTQTDLLSESFCNSLSQDISISDTKSILKRGSFTLF